MLEGRCGTSGLPSLGALLPTMLGTEGQRNWGLTSACKLGEVAKREGVRGLEVQRLRGKSISLPLLTAHLGGGEDPQ